ncbi:MAG: hypothetical protein JWN99_3389 [Ilumatobacteraceae bacterium]|nr:hypothetical protein [Ilumatobacteraceae bacterium]
MPVPRQGARTYRRSIRARGPLVALVPPAMLGILAMLMLHNSHTTTRGVGGFVAAVFAVPLLPAFGVPVRSGGSLYLLAVVASAVVWLVVGLIASRRATMQPFATWGGYWAEYLLLAASVWVGVVLSLVVADLVLGRTLL